VVGLKAVPSMLAFFPLSQQLLDKTLIPNASNAELKALLVKVRPAIAAHLDHAKMLQTTVSSLPSSVE
jgi:hypothetical protein